MPWEAWLQLNWEFQNGRETATEVRSAGRNLEAETAIQQTSAKAICWMKADPNWSVPYQVAKKEVQPCQERGDVVDIIQAEGNSFQTSLPTYSAINMPSPDTPAFPSQPSWPPGHSPQPPVLCPPQGQARSTPRGGWWKPVWTGEKE